MGADAIDAQLHGERVDPGTRGHRLHEARLDTLPDGAFVLEGGEPWLVLGQELLRWTPAGYVGARPRPASEQVTVVTPPSLVAVLRTGWEGVVPLVLTR